MQIRCGFPRRAMCVAIPALGALLTGFAPGGVAAEDGAGASRSAVLVFVSYDGNLPSPPDPTRIRLAASRELAAALERLGRPAVTCPDLEPTMRRWRIRSERDLGPDFLGALASEFSATEVMVVGLCVYRDRVLFLARGVSAPEGRLAWADSDEELRTGETAGAVPDTQAEPESQAAQETQAEPDTQVELEELTAAAAVKLALASLARPAELATQGLVVMPLVAVGVDRGPSSLAVQCLLRSLVETGHWIIPDPTLVVSALQHEGYDPLQLEEGSRHSVSARFGTKKIIVPRLVSFPSATSFAPPPSTTDDLETRAQEWSPDVPMYLSLAVIDCASGLVQSGEGEYLAPENPYRIFGRMRDVSLARHFQAGTDRLVQSLIAAEGGGSE